jgi:UDP-GlcNAc:undecaprenyl-phosphate/decaprenyl-phosphate GlcNAc-1-phosphate transferase
LLLPPARRAFTEIGIRWMYVGLVSFSISFSTTPIFGWMARKAGIVDFPDARKNHLENTPLLGGAAVFVGFVLALGVNGIFSQPVWGILVASAFLFLVGVIDDYRQISAAWKLLVQLAVSLIVIGSGIVLRVLPDSLGWVSSAGNFVLTIVWLVGITNAMNFFDGMDGNAAGLGTIIAFFLGMVAFQTDQFFIGWIAIAMMGACAGFLPHNLHLGRRADIFLGDAGSTLIGFTLACVAVYGDWATDRPLVALISPVLIFWILIFDMVHITVARILTGKVKNFRQWIDYVGTDHLHHRLADTLGSSMKSVIFIYLISICLGISAVVLLHARSIDAMLLLLQAAIIVLLITVLERRKNC